jgi:hypothetical protein
MRRTEQPQPGAPSASPFRFPKATFSSASGSTRPGALQTLSRPGPDARVSLSLACNESRFHGLHSRVNVPGLPLRFLTDGFHDPFGPSLRYRPPGCARDRQHRRSWPVAVSTAGLTCRRADLHSPSGLLHPSGSKRSAGLLQAGPPSELARCPFAPRRGQLSLGYRFGSTFPSRYVSGGLLFLKPLGTSFTMTPKRIFVNCKMGDS